jgi:hypothetical protein
MILSITVDIGNQLIAGVATLSALTQIAINISIGVVVGLLLIRLLIDASNISPFGRVTYYARRPTNEVIQQMRSSQYYLPLRRSLGFDPAVLMVLIALAILWYVVSGVLGNLFSLVQGLGGSLIDFGRGNVFTGARHLIGVGLLAVIFFFMTLMTIVFINWLFGLAPRAAFWAMERLRPLLQIFEFGGVFAGWSFIIFWLVLNFAAIAVSSIFMS